MLNRHKRFYYEAALYRWKTMDDSIYTICCNFASVFGNICRKNYDYCELFSEDDEIYLIIYS